MTNYKQLKPGQKVRNNYGQTLTVREQKGCQVFVVEDSFSWYHPAKLHATEDEPLIEDTTWNDPTWRDGV
jgi:hypothetical protein